MKKKLGAIVCLYLTIMFAIPQCVYAAVDSETITMYHPSNGQIEIREVEKSDYKTFKDNGWYDEPIQYVYAPNKFTIVVTVSKARTMIKNGDWYEYPVQTLYSADGRTEVFNKKDVPAQLAVGWYDHPVQTLYSLDGRAEVFDKKDVPAQLAVGWYTEPMTIMWSWDGTRTQVVPINEVEANEAVGWCYGKPVRMYFDGGEEMIVGEKRVETYKNLNWSTEPFVRIYIISEGCLLQQNVPADHVASYVAYGCTTTRPKANYQFNLQTAKNKAYEYLKELIKRPSTLEIYSVDAYDSTNSVDWDIGHIVYTICYDCSAMNGYGGYTRSIIRIEVTFSIYSGEYVTFLIN